MIPRTVARNLARLQPSRIGSCTAILSRCQSTGQAPAQSTSTRSNPNFNRDRNDNDGKPRVGADGKPFRPRMHTKLKDITVQINQAIDTNSDFAESIDIFEEGIQYLHEIAQEENINIAQIRYHFSVSAEKLFGKMFHEKASISNQQRLLDVMAEYGLAHRYYFSLMAYNYMHSDLPAKTIYRHILQLWVGTLELENSKDSRRFVRPEIEGFNFRFTHLLNLAYFAYANSCALDNVHMNPKDLTNLLRQESLPRPYHVQSTLTDFGVSEKFANDMKEFLAQATHNYQKFTNPNDLSFNRRIQDAVDGRNIFNLDRIWQEVNELSKSQNIALKETTLIRFMNAFFDCGNVDQVFKIFQHMIANGIDKPNLETWEIVLRAFGSTKNLKGKSDAEKLQVGANIERTFEMMLKDLQITAKTLSIIVGAFANLNQFDKVDEYLNRFSVQGDGDLPIIAPIKNNILVGLIMNNRIQEAELKLKEYMNEGNYVPLNSVMNTFLTYHSQKKNYDAVEKIFEFMKNYNIPEDIATYTIIIDVYFKLHRQKGLVPDLGAILAGLKSSTTVDFNDVTCTTLIDGLAKDGANIDAARSVYESYKTKFKGSAFMHSAMLKTELDYGSIAYAEEIFDFYIKNIRRDTRIWNMMITGLLPKYEDLALVYYDRFKSESDFTAKPNNFTWYFLLNHFNNKRNSDKIQMVIDDLKHVKLQQLGTKLPGMLLDLSESHQLDPQLQQELAKYSKQ